MNYNTIIKKKYNMQARERKKEKKELDALHRHHYTCQQKLHREYQKVKKYNKGSSTTMQINRDRLDSKEQDYRNSMTRSTMDSSILSDLDDTIQKTDMSRNRFIQSTIDSSISSDLHDTIHKKNMNMENIENIDDINRNLQLDA